MTRSRSCSLRACSKRTISRRSSGRGADFDRHQLAGGTPEPPVVRVRRRPRLPRRDAGLALGLHLEVCTSRYIHPMTVSERPLPPHWFQILLALANRDLHGLGIMNDVLAQTAGQMRLWPAMLYRNLGRLTTAGLVEEIEPPRTVETG